MKMHFKYLSPKISSMSLNYDYTPWHTCANLGPSGFFIFAAFSNILAEHNVLVVPQVNAGI